MVDALDLVPSVVSKDPTSVCIKTVQNVGLTSLGHIGSEVRSLLVQIAHQIISLDHLLTFCLTLRQPCCLCDALATAFKVYNSR